MQQHDLSEPGYPSSSGMNSYQQDVHTSPSLSQIPNRRISQLTCNQDPGSHKLAQLLHNYYSRTWPEAYSRAAVYHTTPWYTALTRLLSRHASLRTASTMVTLHGSTFEVNRDDYQQISSPFRSWQPARRVRTVRKKFSLPGPSHDRLIIRRKSIKASARLSRFTYCISTIIRRSSVWTLSANGSSQQ